MGSCAKCGKQLTPSDKRFKLMGEVLCAGCIDQEASKGNTCPCCKCHINGDGHEVGLVLTPPGSSFVKKARAVEVLAIVCPECRVMFFDEFTYKTLQTLKK